MSKPNTNERMLQEMITTFIPATEQEINDNDTTLLTTDELAQRMEPLMHVDKGDLSRALFDAGSASSTRATHGNGCSSLGNQEESCIFAQT